MMKTLLAAAAATLCCGAALACPWAGNSYKGEENVNVGGRLQIEFAIDATCSQMTFSSIGNAGFQPVDTPQQFPLTQRHNHWEADINGARATFSADGKWVEFFANGNNVRVNVDPTG